jgi:hypothetical protein
MSSRYTCINCNYATDNCFDFKKHTQTMKHVKRMKSVNQTALVCTICDEYKTCNKSHLTRHAKSCIQRNKKQHAAAKGDEKPVKEQAAAAISNEVLERIVDVQSILADTMVEVKSRIQSLEALCTSDQKLKLCTTDMDSIVSVIKETVSQLTPTVINNVNNGTIDNRMNINVFLNEHCKDAMNIMDFVKSIQLRHSDLDKFASLGYVNAMSNIMVNELNNLPLTQRPLHCTDVRRSTLHIKHDDAWHKEEKDSAILLRAIKTLRRLCNNMAYERFPRPSQIVENSVQDFLYTKIISEVTGGRGANNNDVYEKRNQKIVTSVCKSVKLNKTDMLSIKNAVP